MKKLTILIDFDDVMNNLLSVWVEFLNEKYGTDVKKDDVRDWDMSLAFPSLTKSQVYEPLKSELLWKRVKPLPDAVEYVRKIMKDGHKIFVVTASNPETIRYKMLHVFQRYFGYLSYESVIVTSHKQMVKGDILIDDAPHNLEGGDYFGLLMDAPHNQKYDEYENGFVRVYDWKDIYKCIYLYANAR